MGSSITSPPANLTPQALSPSRNTQRRVFTLTLIALAALALIAFILCMTVIRTVSIPDMSKAGRAAHAERKALMVWLLPPDAIPADFDPHTLPADQANYADEEGVIGVEFNGEARAYSIPYLNEHELVNDTVGGIKIAVTW